MHNHVPKPTLRRLPLYLSYIRTLPNNGDSYVSATSVAKALGLHEVQVRKDLASISDGGKPKIGYNIDSLIDDIENFLGYDNESHAILVGTDKMAEALASYDGLKDYNLTIDCIFDPTGARCGSSICGKDVLPMTSLPGVCCSGTKIGILSVPANEAQSVAAEMVAAGMKIIWNFSPVYLKLSKDVFVQNDNIASSFSAISRYMKFSAHG